MKKGVLFICYGNSCRSIMAEALARHVWGASLRIASAGIRPLGWVASETLEALDELGVPVDGLRSKGFAEIDLDRFDIVVNLTSTPLSGYLPRSTAGKIVDFPVEDPFGEGIGVYRRSRDVIAKLVREKLPLWLDAASGGKGRSDEEK